MGRWVTVKGRRVFLEDGETPTQAIERSKRENLQKSLRNAKTAKQARQIIKDTGYSVVKDNTGKGAGSAPKSKDLDVWVSDTTRIYYKPSRKEYTVQEWRKRTEEEVKADKEREKMLKQNPWLLNPSAYGRGKDDTDVQDFEKQLRKQYRDHGRKW